MPVLANACGMVCLWALSAPGDGGTDNALDEMAVPLATIPLLQSVLPQVQQRQDDGYVAQLPGFESPESARSPTLTGLNQRKLYDDAWLDWGTISDASIGEVPLYTAQGSDNWVSFRFLEVRSLWLVVPDERLFHSLTPLPEAAPQQQTMPALQHAQDRRYLSVLQGLKPESEQVWRLSSQIPPRRVLQARQTLTLRPQFMPWLHQDVLHTAIARNQWLNPNISQPTAQADPLHSGQLRRIERPRAPATFRTDVTSQPELPALEPVPWETSR